jgi:hypothetical protein
MVGMNRSLTLAGCLAVCVLAAPHLGAQSDVSVKAINVNLRALVSFAFDLRAYQLTGGPDWMDASIFHIDLVDAEALRGDVSSEKDRAKFQATLAERFKLKFHRESRQMPVYALQTINSGEGPGNGIWIGVATPSADGRTLARFAKDLGRSLDRPVFDATNLAGQYDLLPNFTKFPLPVITPPDIGLKLEPQQSLVEMFVIDSASKPAIETAAQNTR